MDDDVTFQQSILKIVGKLLKKVNNRGRFNFRPRPLFSTFLQMDFFFGKGPFRTGPQNPEMISDSNRSNFDNQLGNVLIGFQLDLLRQFCRTLTIVWTHDFSMHPFT